MTRRHRAPPAEPAATPQRRQSPADSSAVPCQRLYRPAPTPRSTCPARRVLHPDPAVMSRPSDSTVGVGTARPRMTARGAAHPSGVMPPARSSDGLLLYPAGLAAMRSAGGRRGHRRGRPGGDDRGCPVVGTVRVVSAGGKILRAPGFAGLCGRLRDGRRRRAVRATRPAGQGASGSGLGAGQLCRVTSAGILSRWPGDAEA